MKLAESSSIRFLGILIAFAWTTIPSISHGAESKSVQQSIPGVQPLVVRLNESNCLQGTVMQVGGKPAANQSVVLGKQGKPIARTSTDDQGRFQFEKIVPGEYQLATSDSVELVSCQPFDTADADAVPNVLMSKEAMITRGAIKDTLFHPLFVGLVIAAAIAIPIAIAANNNKDAS